jgi:hypothetical protein
MSAESTGDYVLERYGRAINYYWDASRHNKQAYKLTRSLTVVLGAVVTLLASLSSASFIDSDPVWKTGFGIATPVLAAILTIVAGFSQAFQWGATWRDMVLNAARLERERDRFYVTEPEERDPLKEVATLNDLVIAETESFFQRILGGPKPEGKEKEPPAGPK